MSLRALPGYALGAGLVGRVGLLSGKRLHRADGGLAEVRIGEFAGVCGRARDVGGHRGLGCLRCAESGPAWPRTMAVVLRLGPLRLTRDVEPATRTIVNWTVGHMSAVAVRRRIGSGELRAFRGTERLQGSRGTACAAALPAKCDQWRRTQSAGIPLGAAADGSVDLVAADRALRPDQGEPAPDRVQGGAH